MIVKLQNTMSGALEPLTPLSGNTVKLYTCGLTVYSQPHIGNWLGYIYWDVLVRLLSELNYHVERTQNITDVGHLTSDDDDGEDKMEKGARQENITAWDIAKKYIEIADHEAYDLLGLVRPDHLVRATDYIEQQIAFTQKLSDGGYLYEIAGDGMYFDTSKIDDYGKLAHLDVVGLQAGIRVSVQGKKHITDFAVWKFSPENTQRDMEWESPWGKGFPGWHLECSVIAYETLGAQIDIHAGGIDHIPVHHTNEIAQTEALTQKQFANLWLHNNHIKIDGKKISKSLGNIVTLQDVIDHSFDVMAFKLMALSKHYRTEGNFTWDILAASQNRLNNWRTIATLRHQTHDTLDSDDDKDSQDDDVSLLATRQAFLEALSVDLNTPEALKIIDDAFSRLEAAPLRSIHRHSLVQLLEVVDDVLGLQLVQATPDIDDDAKRLILQRERAREEKDWTESDKLRAALAKKGIAVRDTPHGTIWQYTS